MGTIVKVSPTKEFFVEMITKDISLEDCILDLIDNSIDAARVASRGDISNLNDYFIELNINPESFSISDNCGGISLHNAIDYAFYFGRRKDAPKDVNFSIGLYGIGMKRAIFKLGRKIEISSYTNEHKFIVPIDVDQWLISDKWDFELDPLENDKPKGTYINVKSLRDDVSKEFTDPVFINSLFEIIGRDYASFLSRGLNIKINDKLVNGYNYAVMENSDFAPSLISYTDDGVNVEIRAGIAALPDDESDKPQKYQDVKNYGWFVLCNDRVVLAADKSIKTIWGRDSFPVWHPQYNGFIGMINFRSEDSSLLPWDTTKRNINLSSSVYKRSIQRMAELTRPWIDFSRKKKDAGYTPPISQNSYSSLVEKIDTNKTYKAALLIPDISKTPNLISIQFRKSDKDVNNVKLALGNARMSNREVGEKVFDYYKMNEVD